MKNARQLVIFITLFIFLISNAQNKKSCKNETNFKKIKVYLLGTFHFAQTDSTYDVMSKKHQKSIKKLTNVIAKLRPAKVFVERQPEYEFQNKNNILYTKYVKTNILRGKNEIFQIGFRVAKKLNHKKIYQCDNPGMYSRFFNNAKKYAEENNQLDILNGKSKGTIIRHEDKIEDSIMQNSTLLNYLKWINSTKVMNASHAFYLSNFPQIGSTDFYNYDDDDTLIGAEVTIDWYRRNILIYSKIINQLSYKEDAIFLVIGYDHVPIIKSFFDANPYFEVVDVNEWLN